MADYPILKDQINAAWLSNLAALLHQHQPTVPLHAFADVTAEPAFIAAGLKQRIDWVARTMWQALDLPFAQAMEICKAISPQLKGLPALVLPQLVENYGLDQPTIAMSALAVFTRDSTAEFAIRPFLVRDPSSCLQQLLVWADSDDEHLRRLASEGSRPRLPWGQAIPLFKREPWHTWPILEKLLQDPSLYVRRSVANHLNDISKDNSAWLMAKLAPLYGQHPQTDWIIKHALRDLLKKRHPDALALFDLVPVAVSAQIDIQTPTVLTGHAVTFAAQLHFPQPVAKLRLEFAIDFVGSNGKPRHKVFQWLKREQVQGSLTLKKSYQCVDRTTRRHYPGVHAVHLIVNGQLVATSSFELINDKATGG